MLIAIFDYLPDEETLDSPAEIYAPMPLNHKDGYQIWCISCHGVLNETPIITFDNSTDCSVWIAANTIQDITDDKPG
jgi:hypothetical protein